MIVYFKSDFIFGWWTQSTMQLASGPQQKLGEPPKDRDSVELLQPLSDKVLPDSYKKNHTKAVPPSAQASKPKLPWSKVSNATLGSNSASTQHLHNAYLCSK